MLKSHPAADAFPMMDNIRIGELKADIAENGQREPITVCDGMILDGRNRYRACIELGIEPKTRNYDGDPWAFAWSLNGARRDLDATVRALVFKRCEDGSEKWAKRLAKIAEEGNRKKAKAAKDGRVGRASVKAKKTLDADHNDQQLKSGGRAVARETRAADAKVSPATMARAEQIARRPDLEEKVVAGDMKPAEALRIIRTEKKRKQFVDHVIASGVECNATQNSWEILNLDALDGLKSIVKSKTKARLIFTDPPYNIGIDYGGGKKADMLPPDKYTDWVQSWLRLCVDCLTDDGSLWVMIGDEYAAEYCLAIKSLGLEIRSWIKWYETFGVNCTNKFNRTSRHIFYAVKDCKSFVFDASAVNRPSDRQTKYGDKRASEKGKIWDDVWQIPRLTGTCDERIPDFPTQLPLALVEPIVLCASVPGDLVIDPFNGSGTTGVAAVRNSRRYVGIDKSEEFVDLSKLRISAI
jgi:site-specific DNA-methyltransferase (adenine-specific)